MQEEQFKSEIKNLEAMQATAYDQIRVHRFVFVQLKRLNLPSHAVSAADRITMLVVFFSIE